MPSAHTPQEVPALRVRALNTRQPRADGRYILYWMTAFRRPHWNFSLDHAIAWAHRLQRPLLVFEPLRCGYPWASDRFHRFVLQGMADNRAAFEKADVTYLPYVETDHGEGSGLLEALAADACLVVGDDFPAFFLPRMQQVAAGRLKILMEVVDGNGLLPLRAVDKTYPTAYAFRRFLQKTLPAHLQQHPVAEPLAHPAGLTGAVLPAAVRQRWQPASPKLLEADSAVLGKISMDHSVGPASFNGGTRAAQACLDRFMDDRLARYLTDRSHPDDNVASGFSPYLHFGHLSVHDVFQRLCEHENWDPSHLAAKAIGSREGWWGMGPAAESFLDEIVTWREVGYNMCAHNPHYDRYETLPPWAQQSLAEHEGDPREHLYNLSQLEEGRTFDRVWNAAQRQLVREGQLQNYMRMLWGKKVLEWSRTPQEALQTLVHLNNKYAVDGRDPNSYSGIFWTFGRYDRPWPERPIFGKIRYMSSDNTVKKLRVKKYLLSYT